MPEAQPLLRVEGVRVRFRAVSRLRALLGGISSPFVFAVMDASFALASGETLGLVGESGSGKTTLVRAITGLNELWSGEVWFEGRSITKRSEADRRPIRRNISMMFQDPVASLSPRQTVRSLILEPFRIHGEARSELEREACALMAMVGLPQSLLGAYPHQLSGGQARRVGIARALALRPKLIIADEPTAGLDVSIQGEVLNLMNELQANLGLSLIIVTHNLPVIRHVSNHLAVMYLGRFVEQGPTSDVFNLPRHPYTQALISAVPQPDPDKRRTNIALKGELPSLLSRPQGCEFHTRCPFSRERCRKEAPQLRDIGSARRVACHFPLA